jgi:hypothetical protein
MRDVFPLPSGRESAHSRIRARRSLISVPLVRRAVFSAGGNSVYNLFAPTRTKSGSEAAAARPSRTFRPHAYGERKTGELSPGLPLFPSPHAYEERRSVTPAISWGELSTPPQRESRAPSYSRGTFRLDAPMNRPCRAPSYSRRGHRIFISTADGTPAKRLPSAVSSFALQNDIPKRPKIFFITWFASG